MNAAYIYIKEVSCTRLMQQNTILIIRLYTSLLLIESDRDTFEIKTIR